MGGKRPDQHNIDPGEAGATDYKTLPQTGHGNSNLDDTIQLDQMQLARSQQDARAGSPAPGNRPAPSSDANRPLRERGSSETLRADSSDADDGESS